MSETEIISIYDVPETAQEKFERERLTRRQALKRFGMTAGMAAFAMFSVDDLAHIVGKAMQQRSGDSKVASLIAEEFQQAGVVMADGTNGCSGGTSGLSTCQHCANQLHLDNCYCVDTYTGNANGGIPDPAMYQHCINQSNINYNKCCDCWCLSGVPVDPNNSCPSPGQAQPPQGCGC